MLKFQPESPISPLMINFYLSLTKGVMFICQFICQAVSLHVCLSSCMFANDLQQQVLGGILQKS